MTAATPSLYVFQGSHPCEAVLAAARYQGVEVRRVELPPVLHRAIVRSRFPAGTVPALAVGEERIQGTSAIFRALDDRSPFGRRLFPDGRSASAIVEAERWGAGNLQDSGRRLIWGHFRRSPEAMRAWADHTDDPVARWIKRIAGRPASRVAATANRATDDRIRADLIALPGVLDHVDALIRDGVIGRDEPNAADFQILSTVGLWMVLADLRSVIAGRPCGIAAARLFPDYVARPGIAAGALPASWLTPLAAIPR